MLIDSAESILERSPCIAQRYYVIFTTKLLAKLITRKLRTFASRTVYQIQLTRNVHGRSRIGCRDVVGFGHNGSYVYKDDPMYPFPAIRFRENTADVIWDTLNLELRDRFKVGEIEIEIRTGIGTMVDTASSVGSKHVEIPSTLYSPLPDSFSKASQQAQLRRYIDARMNPVTGLSSLWDYENDMWKV
ncbi:Cytochrome c oxidase subunit 4 isoform 1, mitochondrial [Eumeta japonica]|uniref:Cytochrome c oxidase subunit 4 isoform 1, mitochondrial n=1 Tax=Eumeta variegata TaxID=151549 RepID=A0A4C1Z9S9_EUMVA|nr:Cytochrome c oxidase subunit 4 isoform 1, mitochondrial [Eumeta japonica]